MAFQPIIRQGIRNVRDGYHVNSAHWQAYKKAMPPLPGHLHEIAVGMVLSDASIRKLTPHGQAHIKFEQGIRQKALIDDLFQYFAPYCFMGAPGIYKDPNGHIKSAWFRTFGHPSFSTLHALLYMRREERYRKTISEGLVHEHVTPRGLAYLIMGDGSRRHRVTTCTPQGLQRRKI